MLDLGVLRKADINDLQKIIEIEHICFDYNIAYTPYQLRYLLTKANSHCLVESIDKDIRGFIIVLYKKRTKVAGIETLNVNPVYQGYGIGKKLLLGAEEDIFSKNIKKIRLEVSTGNIPAIKLYQKSGFRVSALLKNYYYHNHFGTKDAYRMIKELTT